MTKTLITAYSDEISLATSKLELDYPMGSYIPSWKIFRAFSKENDIIANTIKDTPTWKKSLGSNIVDIGTGDGLVLKKLLLDANIQRTTIVEPNKKLLEEAKNNLRKIEQLKTINCYLQSVDYPKLYCGNELSLLIHVLYLLEEGSLTKFISKIPAGSRVIIITDERESLFKECWNLTAEKFAKRSSKIHTEIERLEKNGDVYVTRTSFKTYLRNPFLINRKDLKESLLSMITYSEFDTLPTDTKIDINEIFASFSISDIVQCDSICYEIEKI